MALDTSNSVLMAYFQQQQTPPGWFDLLTIMVDGMVTNVGETESQPFLKQMGETMADRFPLSVSQTVGELEAAMNAKLAAFGWGVVDIAANDDGMLLRHQALPVYRDAAGQTRWCNALCAILEGLYGRWLYAQGGEAKLVVKRHRLFSVSDVQFRYFNPQ